MPSEEPSSDQLLAGGSQGCFKLLLDNGEEGLKHLGALGDSFQHYT